MLFHPVLIKMAYSNMVQVVITFGIQRLYLLFGLRKNARLWKWLIRASILPIFLPWFIGAVLWLTLDLDEHPFAILWLFTLPAVSFLGQLFLLITSLRFLGYEYSRD